MVPLVLLIVLLLVAWVTVSLKPKSPKLRKVVRFLSLGGVYLFVAAILLFGYLFDTADSFSGSPPEYYNYLGWVSLYGMGIGPLCTLAALLIALFAKVKKI